jgi:ATP-binding cassette subfamily F protein 3
MSIISLQDIEKSYGPHSVLKKLSLQIYKGRRVGLIGPNGCGKSTLFKIIAGLESPDKGTVFVQKKLRISYLPQESAVPANQNITVFEAACEGIKDILALRSRLETIGSELGRTGICEKRQALSEYDRLYQLLEQQNGWLAESSIKRILIGLGLKEETHSQPLNTLSGGQRSRLLLAQTLIRPSDVLLLDESTNHLDLQGIEWLETFLKTYKGTILLISHDRFLLDQLTDQIVEIENGAAVCYKGNFSSFLEQKKTRRLSQERILQRRKEFIEKTLDFIARNKDQEGMRGTARGRKIRLRRLLLKNPEFLQELPEQERIFFRFGSPSGRSEILLRAEALTKRFGPTTLFEKVNIEVERGSRTVIIGPNGSGKTTLLKILLGLLPPDEGNIYRGGTVRIGYLDQHAQTLSAASTVLEEAAATRPDLTPEQLRSRLAAFLFKGEQVFQKIETLSGGQRSRLMLAKLVLQEPDLLILDEPTNHLDIESREVLEEALCLYEGAILAVSHDRYFIDALFDRMLILGCTKDGCFVPAEHTWFRKIEGETGIFTQWTQTIQARLQKENAIAEKERRQKEQKASARDVRSSAAATPPEIRQFNAWKLDAIEEKILSLEEEIENLSLQYGKEEIYRDKASVIQLQETLDKKKSELALLYKAYQWRTSKKNQNKSS